MARYIDADMLRIEMEELYEHHIEMRNFSADGAVADCLTMLNNAPTADVVEVVRCEKCKNGDVATLMDMHTAIEQAYKNGYEAGIKEFAEAIKKAFPSIAGATDYFVEEKTKGGEAR